MVVRTAVSSRAGWPSLPTNADVAAQFELLADIFELEDVESFRVLAYRRAATRIRETGTSVAQMALDGKAKELQGVGKTIEEKIVQIVEDGEVHALTKHKQLVPTEVVEFIRIPGLGPKTARRIWHELGITTLEGLREAAEAEQLRTLSGLGPRSEENVLRALAEAKQEPGPVRALLGAALPTLLEAVEELRAHPAAIKVSEAGSARRRRETVRDVDIIATARDPDALIAHFTELPWVVEVAARGGTKATVVSGHGLRFDLRVVPPECYGNLLQHFTGSKNHNIAMREEAQRRGLSISEYGVLVTETGETITHKDEKELYEFLGYQFIPPELRENAGELEAAREGSLPKLVELEQLKGDLHTHTTWSADGHNTVEEMALAADRARLRVPRDHRPLALPAGGPDGGAGQGDRCRQQAARAVPAAEGRGGRTSAPTARSTCRTRCWPSATGSWRRSTRRSTAIRPSAVRSDGESTCRLHRAPDCAEDRPP